ncbi:hypothetical protein N9L68_06235 [bacterium]|nr:hypothetical protein [bacterium]
MRTIAAVQEPPAELSPDTCTWLVSMWNAASHLNGKHKDVATKCVEVISWTITRTTAGTAEEHATLAVFDEHEICIVSDGGLMRGFQLCAPEWQPSEALVATWVRMHEHGILDGPADGDAQSLHGVASCLTQAMLFKHDLTMKATPAMRRAVGCVRPNV